MALCNSGWPLVGPILCDCPGSLYLLFSVSLSSILIQLLITSSLWAATLSWQGHKFGGKLSRGILQGDVQGVGEIFRGKCLHGIFWGGETFGTDCPGECPD